MPNTIYYSPKALNDLDEIAEYILSEFQNPIAANNTIQSIKKEIAELKTLNDIGVKVILPGNLITPYRFIQANNYLCFYRRTNSDVYIDRILYKKRDYLKILFRNLIN